MSIKLRSSAFACHSSRLTQGHVGGWHGDGRSAEVPLIREGPSRCSGQNKHGARKPRHSVDEGIVAERLLPSVHLTIQKCLRIHPKKLQTGRRDGQTVVGGHSRGEPRACLTGKRSLVSEERARCSDAVPGSLTCSPCQGSEGTELMSAEKNKQWSSGGRPVVRRTGLRSFSLPAFSFSFGCWVTL